MFSIMAPLLVYCLEDPMLMFAEATNVSDAETKLLFRLPTAVPMFLSKSSWRGDTVPWPRALYTLFYTSELLTWYFLIISSARMF